MGQKKMCRKRRNNGRVKKNRGKTASKRCDNCNAMVPKDKVIKKHQVKVLIESAAIDDVKAMSVYDTYVAPRFALKLYYCVSCAVHLRIVRVRAKWMRKKRDDGVRRRN